MNVCMFLGRVTKDIELRKVQSGDSVTNFSLAINNRYKKNDKVVEETVFVDCEAWGKTAEFAAKYFSKGDVMRVTASAKNHTWEKDGETRSQLRFKVDKIDFVPSTKNGNSGGKKEEELVTVGGDGDNGDGDVPF